jgi:hypothetical protein
MSSDKKKKQPIHYESNIDNKIIQLIPIKDYVTAVFNKTNLDESTFTMSVKYLGLYSNGEAAYVFIDQDMCEPCRFYELGNFVGFEGDT